MKFENELPIKQCREFHKILVEKFRVPFDKRDSRTHGPIWNNLRERSDWINIKEFDETIFNQCYIFHENGRQSALFDSTLNSFLAYIKRCSCRDREPLYAVKKDFSVCVSWHAEDGLTEQHYLAISKI